MKLTVDDMRKTHVRFESASAYEVLVELVRYFGPQAIQQAVKEMEDRGESKVIPREHPMSVVPPFDAPE